MAWLITKLFLVLYNHSTTARWLVVEHLYKYREENHKAYDEHLKRLEGIYGKERLDELVKKGLIKPHEL